MIRKPLTNLANMAGGDLLQIMEDELCRTVAAYEALLDQCRKLADSMGYYHEVIIGKVMPKTTADRTNTGRITEWFESEKHGCLDHILALKAEQEQDIEREKLIASLNLTPEQIELLGLDKLP
jgi:anti-sigma factor ChrR (cupin superfamily)